MVVWSRQLHNGEPFIHENAVMGREKECLERKGAICQAARGVVDWAYQEPMSGDYILTAKEFRVLAEAVKADPEDGEDY